VRLIYIDQPFAGMIASCIQMGVDICQREVNSQKALHMADLAADEGAELIIFPELFLTGFCRLPEAQDWPPFPSLEPFRALARERSCALVGSIMSGRENLGFYLDEGQLDLRPKIHPFGSEKEHFDGGNLLSPIYTRLGSIGLEICYDLRFPEVARSLAVQGADYLITVAQFPRARLGHWKALAVARAIENQMPHIACNCPGPECSGSSLIIDSWGDILSLAGEEETVILGEVDLSRRDAIRREINCFADRRDDLY
jgi:predicted amidohydrolase